MTPIEDDSERIRSTAPQPVAEEPYSIFDKRQKAIIVLISSTAATCKHSNTHGIRVARTLKFTQSLASPLIFTFLPFRLLLAT
jgi:hypothetical protein